MTLAYHLLAGMPEDPILNQGWLQKQDHQAWSNKWKPRYFVLKANRLDYFRDDTRDEHLQTIDLLKIIEQYGALDRGPRRHPLLAQLASA